MPSPHPIARAQLFGIAAVFFLLTLSTGPAAQDVPQPPPPAPAQRIWVGRFSGLSPGSALPAPWRPLSFPGIAVHTRYDLVRDAGRTVVLARSHAGASAMIRPLHVDLGQFPILNWRWKAERLIPGENLYRRSGDDYPARVYVNFAYQPDRAGLAERLRYAAAKLIYGAYPPGRSLNYIWSGRQPVGTMAPNAYTSKAMMIVVTSGKQPLGTWVSIRRDVAADFQAAFGEAPPPVVSVAIMSDTDDTGAEAETYFGDISFSRR